MSLRIERIVLIAQDSRLSHLTQRIEFLLTRSNGEHRARHHRRDQTFDTIPGERKDRFQNRVQIVQLQLADSRNAVQQKLTGVRGEVTLTLKALAESVDP